MIVAELTRRGIPIKVKGADLFQTPELRDAMAVLRIIDASHPVALFRVAALPQFNIDPERFRANWPWSATTSLPRRLWKTFPAVLRY